jgi:hypothetical protein
MQANTMLGWWFNRAICIFRKSARNISWKWSEGVWSLVFGIWSLVSVIAQIVFSTCLQ